MRKPLTGIDNRAAFDSLYKPARSILLSGNMLPVKKAFLNSLGKKNDTPIIKIALDNSGSLIPAGTRFDYSLHDDNSGFDMFSSMSIREVCLYLQNVGYEKNYTDEQIVQIIRYLQMIARINTYLGLELPTIRDINAYYYKPDVIGNALASMLHCGSITPQEYDRLNISVIRGIKGQLIIDNLLAATDFNLKSGAVRNERLFSPAGLKNGQIAVLDLSERHGSYTENKCRRDVFYSIESCSNITVLLDIGAADYSLASDFIRNMTDRPNCRLIAVIDDIFAQCADYDSVRRRFSYNLFGQHTGQSCLRMCECFHEAEKAETHYSRSTDNRIFADRFIDVLFHTNHSDTISTVPARRSIIEQEDIVALSERSFIVLDNTGSTDYFSIQSI